MDSTTASFGTKLLQRSKNQTEYNIYKAALEWDLSDPIVIESQKDMRSENRWHERVKPFDHQIINLITFCRRVPVTLLASEDFRAYKQYLRFSSSIGLK